MPLISCSRDRTYSIAPLAGDRLDSTDSRRDSAFAENFEQANIAGALRVSTTAELSAEVADGHHSDRVAVLFAEERDRAWALASRIGMIVGVTGTFSRILG